MKVNRTRSKAKANMRRFGQKKNRPEQILAEALLQAHLPTFAIVDREEMVKVDNPDEPGIKEVSVDITIRFARKKVAIEMNGPPHDEIPQIRRDSRKEILLTWPGNDWICLVFDYNKMPILFLRNTRELTYDETVRAYREIIIAVGDILPLKDASPLAIKAILRKTQLS